MFLKFGTVLLPVLLSSAAAFAAEVRPPSPLSTDGAKSQTETIVKEYILTHPEVLLESLKQFQAKQEAAKKQLLKDSFLQRKEDMLDGPAQQETATGPTIIEFFDNRCGYCKKITPTLAEVVAAHPNVRVVYKEFPILGPESLLAAQATLAARKQGKYFELHNAFLSAAEPLTAKVILDTAAKIGLDMKKLQADMDDPEVQTAIQKNYNLANALQIQATPTFVIDGEVMEGAMDRAGFDAFLSRHTQKTNQPSIAAAHK